jgi:hypothetical protein
VEQISIRRALWKTISEVDNYHEMVEDDGEAVRHRLSRSGSTSFRKPKTGELGRRFKRLYSAKRNLLNEAG